MPRRCVSVPYSDEMDAIDRRIIALLRENARRSFADIGGHVALSAPAVKRRVDRLEAEGVIRSYAAVVDPSAMGWHTHAVVALYCEGRMSGGEVRTAIEPHPEV
jgi:DNA-binding Lrp family transcriptional regulator